MAKGIDMSDPAVAEIMNNLPDVTDSDGTTKAHQVDHDLQLSEIADVLEDVMPREQKDSYVEKGEVDEESLPTEPTGKKKEKAPEKKVEVEEEPVGEQEQEQEPEVEEDEESDEDDPQAELEALKAQVATLRTTLAEFAEGNTPAPASQQQQAEEPAQQQKKASTEPPELFTEEELDAMLADPTALHKGLQRIYTRAKEDGMRDAVQVATTSLTRQTQLQAQAEAYFNKNEDIRPYRGFMTKYINDIYAKNPKLTFPQLLDEAGKLTREKLALANAARGVDKKTQERASPPAVLKGQKPAFARGTRNGSARQSVQKGKATGLVAEIEDLITD